MRAKSFSRWQAAGTHLLICVAIAAAAIAVLLDPKTAQPVKMLVGEKIE